MAKLIAYNYICPVGGESLLFFSESNTLTQFTGTICDSPQRHTLTSPFIIDKQFILSFAFRITLSDNDAELNLSLYESHIVDVTAGSLLTPTRIITLPDPSQTEDWICIKTHPTPIVGTTLILRNLTPSITFQENSNQDLTIVQDGRYIVFCKTMTTPIQWRRFTSDIPFVYPNENENEFINTTYSDTKVYPIEKSNNLNLVGGTYNEILRKRSVVYGIDNQNNSGSICDINTQNGIYRIGGLPVIRGTNYLTKSSDVSFGSSGSGYISNPAHDLVIQELPVGVYKLEIMILHSQILAAPGGRGRIIISQVPPGTSVASFDYRNSVNNEISTILCYIIITLATPITSSAPRTYRIGINRAAGSGQAQVKFSRMNLWRLT